MTDSMITLYDGQMSGNAYKVRLVLSQLGHAFRCIEKDVMRGETRTDEFLAINPNGRIPTVVLPGGEVLAESNAIIWYFAEGTPLLPKDKLQRAQVLQWMFFEQYSHEPFIAVLRFWSHLPDLSDEQISQIADKKAKGYAALDVMEKHLRSHDYFVGGQYSIADVALYAYTHVADEGGFELSSYPAINAWMARVASQPDHININTPAGL